MEQLIPNKIVKAGEAVFREGDDPSEGLYFICYGEVKVFRNEYGTPRDLATLGAGDVFGEMGIINAAPRNASVTAITDCGFFTLSQHNFQHRVNQLDPMLRGSFRVFVLTIRDLMAQRDVMLGQMNAMAQQLQHLPSAIGAELTNDPNVGLASGVARKLNY